MSEEKAKKSHNRYLYVKRFEAYEKSTDAKLKDIESRAEKVSLWMKIFILVIIVDIIVTILA